MEKVVSSVNITTPIEPVKSWTINSFISSYENVLFFNCLQPFPHSTLFVRPPKTPEFYEVIKLHKPRGHNWNLTNTLNFAG